MKCRNLFAGAIALLVIIQADIAIAQTRRVEIPMAEIKPHNLTIHGHTRVDNYFWLRDRNDPKVIAYLKAENEYTNTAMAPTEELRATLFEEIKGRIVQDDATVPYQDGDYFYYRRFEDGKEYAIHARKKGSLDAPEEIMVDGNALAEGHDYFSIALVRVSSGQNVVAFSVDTVGRRFHTIRFKDLETGEMLDDKILSTTQNLQWANDNSTLFYARQDPETLRSYRIYRHRLGTDPATDELVYEEPDTEFSVNISKTKSRAYLLIRSSHTLSTEYRYLSADDPMGEFEVILPRERDHEYRVFHLGDDFYIRTNDSAQNFRLVKAPVGRSDRSHWEEVIAHRDDVLLGSLEVFRDYLVVSERRDGLNHYRVMPRDGSAEHDVDFGEPAYRTYFEVNRDVESKVLRYAFSSLTTPNSVFDYNLDTREKTLLKQDKVLGGFSADDYVAERRFVTARDGERVPVSIVYREDTPLEGASPLLLYAYGSYGASMDAYFDPMRVSLLDRGFVYAIAHVRGGQEMGRRWYNDGKLFNKKNTFTDFIDVGEFLIEEGYADAGRLFAMGGSAGGLLMGAITNMRPDLWNGVVAQVPFVDIVTTMLDESIPLTTFEYDEWGNPNEEEYYRYMLSYSPYDQVEAKDYPNLLVTTGLQDSQVQFWEPAKWVAKLRALKTDANMILLKTNMEAGHGGASGRYGLYEERAFDYAFLLYLAGLEDRA